MTRSILLRNARRTFLAAIFFATLAPCLVTAQTVETSATANVERDQEEELWFRVLREENVPIALETSIVAFTGQYNERPVSVSLIGAIHLAEKDYYLALNEKFQEFDVVVFELVAPKGAEIKSLLKYDPDGASKAPSPVNVVGFIQYWIGKALGFSYQVDCVNYGVDNLVRGDCDAEEFYVKLLVNGDFFRFFYNVFLDSFLADPDREDLSTAGLLAICCASDKRLVARRYSALEMEGDSFVEAERQTRELNALKTLDANDEEYQQLLEKYQLKERENVIIHFRNQKALQEVRRQLQHGHSNIAVFYGAAHLPDLAEKLQDDFNLQLDPNVEWLRAWDMPRSK